MFCWANFELKMLTKIFFKKIQFLIFDNKNFKEKLGILSFGIEMIKIIGPRSSENYFLYRKFICPYFLVHVNHIIYGSIRVLR